MHARRRTLTAILPLVLAAATVAAIDATGGRLGGLVGLRGAEGREGCGGKQKRQDCCQDSAASVHGHLLAHKRSRQFRQTAARRVVHLLRRNNWKPLTLETATLVCGPFENRELYIMLVIDTSVNYMYY